MQHYFCDSYYSQRFIDTMHAMPPIPIPIHNLTSISAFPLSFVSSSTKVLSLTSVLSSVFSASALLSLLDRTDSIRGDASVLLASLARFAHCANGLAGAGP